VPRQTLRHAYIITLKKLGFEEEKGQLREWMTVAREIDQQGEDSKLNSSYRSSSRLIHESPQALREHERQKPIDKLAETVAS
jgi:hypothetical protein